MFQKLETPGQAAALFEGWEETMIWSCLSGTMGEIYGGGTSAVAVLGDFAFFAGEPSGELARLGAGRCHILVPQNDGWAGCIRQSCGEKVRPSTRYAIKKEPGVFDRAWLERAALPPPGHRLQAIDEEWFYRCRREGWSEDMTAQYRDWEQFSRQGLGVLVLRGEELVAGASSYSGWPGGIEVEIDTRPDCRRQGLATAAGAGLILACLDRGWYPSWDAQNKESLGLAEKLGYHFSHEYLVYLVEG